MPQYEIMLKKDSPRGEGHFQSLEYGFAPNPPICVTARNITEAKRKLKLPKNVKIKSIQKI